MRSVHRDQCVRSTRSKKGPYVASTQVRANACIQKSPHGPHLFLRPLLRESILPVSKNHGRTGSWSLLLDEPGVTFIRQNRNICANHLTPAPVYGCARNGSAQRAGALLCGLPRWSHTCVRVSPAGFISSGLAASCSSVWSALRTFLDPPSTTVPAPVPHHDVV